eukprot:PhM_4_TR3793/c1_g1_i1/m.25762
MATTASAVTPSPSPNKNKNLFQWSPTLSEEHKQQVHEVEEVNQTSQQYQKQQQQKQQEATSTASALILALCPKMKQMMAEAAYMHDGSSSGGGGELEGFANPEADIRSSVCFHTFHKLLTAVPCLPDAATVDDRYEFIDKKSPIGFGTFGTVYAVRPREAHVAISTAYDIVLKEVSLPSVHACTSLRDFFQWKSFLLEVLTLKDLRHPYMTAFVEGFRTEDGHGYIVMQRAKGKNLLQLLSNPATARRVREPDVFRVIMAQLCCVLEQLHRNGLAHRDIKPENIVVDLDDRVTTTLVDFGSVYIENLDGPEGASPSVGTTMYLSSETLEHALGFRSSLSREEVCAADVFGLGVVAFITFFGAHPFNVHRLDSLENVRQKTLRSTSQHAVTETLTVDSTGAAELDKLLPRMLSMDAAARPTVVQIIQELMFVDNSDGDDKSSSSCVWRRSRLEACSGDTCRPCGMEAFCGNNNKSSTTIDW